MIYNNLILNKYVFKKLTSFHNKNHLPNAFIFHGSEGVGKEAHALEFFAFINCMENNINEACGTCKSCNKVKKIQHELLNLIVPLPKTKPIGKNSNPLNALSNKEQAELINQFSKKGVEPYHKIVLDKANTIIINSIKSIKNSSSLSIPEGQVKLHLIFEADKLCYPRQESANALLKMLEEPKENNIFILVTSDISKIIDTILSRCVPIFFKDISSNNIEEIISKKSKRFKEKMVVAKLCQGNIHKAFDLINSFDEKMKVLNALINSIKSNNINLWNAQFNRKNKAYICDNLDLLIFFFRDLDFIKHNNISKIYFSRFINLYNEYNNQNNEINWNDCVKLISDAQNYLFRNGYPRLISAALFIEIQNIISSKNHCNNFALNEWVA